MPIREFNNMSKENKDTNIIVLLNKAVYLYPYFFVSSFLKMKKGRKMIFKYKWLCITAKYP